MSTATFSFTLLFTALPEQLELVPELPQVGRRSLQPLRPLYPVRPDSNASPEKKSKKEYEKWPPFCLFWNTRRSGFEFLSSLTEIQ